MNFRDEVAQKEKLDELRNQQAQTAQQMVGQCGQAMQGLGRRVSLREEAEHQVGYHRVQADKQDRAVAFFREHPEFDEFVQLIRDGVIGI
jgi:hypothetical protein